MRVFFQDEFISDNERFEGENEKGDGGDSLLSVNDDVIIFSAVWVLGINHTSEEVVFAVVDDKRNQVIIELFALFFSPVVVTLIDRDAEHVSLFHHREQFSSFSFHFSSVYE